MHRRHFHVKCLLVRFILPTCNAPQRDFPDAAVMSPKLNNWKNQNVEKFDALNVFSFL